MLGRLGSMEYGYEVSVPTTQWDITPYYMATTACDLFHAARVANDKVKHDWHKYFMYCVGIELGLKAVLLNNTMEQKTEKSEENRSRPNYFVECGDG